MLWKKRAKRFNDTVHVKEISKHFHWFFGHSLSEVAQFDRILDYLTERFEKLDVDTMWSSVGSVRRLITRDPMVVKHFMKDNFENYKKGKYTNDLAFELLGNGIFVTDDEQWKVNRKTASHLFTNHRLKHQMTFHFVETADRLVKKLEELSGNDQTVDMFEMFNRMTIQAFVQIAFGYNIRVIERAPEEVPFMRAFDKAQDHMTERLLVPVWIWKLMRFFSIGGEGEIKESTKVLDEFVERLHKLKQDGEPGEPDLLSLFLDQGKRYTSKPPTKQEIKDVVLNFISAGRDTTAQTLTWVLYILDKNPEAKAKVIEEVQANQGLSYFKRAEMMTYTHAVMSETLRLFPLINFSLKTAQKDDVLPNGFKVPAGTQITFMPWAMGRNTKIWGKDARRFKPERWLGDRVPADHEFVSFNAGKRACLGKKFAYLQSKIVLTKFLEKFTYKLDDSRMYVAKAVFTLPVREGFHCILKKRMTTT